MKYFARVKKVAHECNIGFFSSSAKIQFLLCEQQTCEKDRRQKMSWVMSMFQYPRENPGIWYLPVVLDYIR